VTPILALSGVSKHFGALRPLRIDRLIVEPGETVAIIGPDAAAAETLTNLITGATLPDQGSIEVFGRVTASVKGSAEWLELVDRLGIVTGRALLLDSLDVLQNLAVPFTLEIDPPSDEVRRRAAALAREVGLVEETWSRPAGTLDGAARARVRLGRALALDPSILLLEHPSATVEPAARAAFAVSVREAAVARRMALVAVTADEGFARAVTSRVLRHDPATGRLREAARWWSPWR
jgi:glutamate transport system ATP-binding protein